MNRSDPPELAPVLQQVLAPVLKASDDDIAVSELSAALAIARAGMALSPVPPAWLSALDQHCAQLQKKCKVVLRAERVAYTLGACRLPKPLRPAAKGIRKVARQEHALAQHALQCWWQSPEGLKSRRQLQKALKRAMNSEPLILSEQQLAEALLQREQHVSKWQQKLRVESNWHHSKKHGRAAQQLRLCQHFLGFFQQHISQQLVMTDAHTAEILRYRQLDAQRRTATWLQQLLEQSLCGNKPCAAAGAMWGQLRARRQHLEREQFVASTARNVLSADFSGPRERPDFPLRLRFGAVDRAV